MSKLENCSMCVKPASFLCACSSDAFLCSEHLQTHMASVPGEHDFCPLKFLILPPNIEVFKNIKTSLLSQRLQKIQEILREREDNLRPLLQKVKRIKNKAKEDINRILEEEGKKIKEIEKMLRTGEVKGSEKETLL